jgi:hypothetical protein
MNPLNILFKYPSRGRPERFFEGMDSIVSNLYDTDNYLISVTLDSDDTTMNNTEVVSRITTYRNTEINFGYSKSKIDAINRSMPLQYEWDIIICMSDDMRFTFYGFDQIIRQEFLDGDLDRLLHVMDQDAKHILATMYIAGRAFYDRFGYIYHPSYKSLFSDNEVQDIAQMMGKYKLVDCLGLILHLNPAYGHFQKDDMFITQQAYWNEDEANYRLRKAINFGL